MRAILCHSWGGPESLTLAEVAPPVPGSGEVRLKVEAAATNFADILMIAGKYQEKPPLPFTPGLEIAGTVDRIGTGVAGLELGERVVALADRGGYAEMAVARGSDVFKMPHSMDFATAAAFPITFGTAHAALTWRADLRADEVLLVTGAAGGVGLAAIEIGKVLGATVIATAGGADKLAVAKAHGADHLIDYKAEDVRVQVKKLTGGRGADVIFDAVGGELFDALLRCVAWSGRILVIGFAAGHPAQIPANIVLVKNLSILGLYWGSYRRHAPAKLQGEFAQLFEWYEQGKLKPHISQRLDLAQASQALASLKNRRSVGKVVLTTAPG